MLIDSTVRRGGLGHHRRAGEHHLGVVLGAGRRGVRPVPRRSVGKPPWFSHDDGASGLVVPALVVAAPQQ